MTTSRPLERVLLVGFMGAGKTSVGRALAARLGWRFVDFDEAVEAEAGASVPEIFEQRGESAFRAIEADVGARLLTGRRVVLASGGGWAVAPGRLEDVPEGTATVWLRVSLDTALARAGRSPGTRPLLGGDSERMSAEELLRRRGARYRHAHWAVDTDGATVDDVTTRILEIIARTYPDTGPE